jgi:deazaflavin-dependent oxidoreductase (nitroreductase family)
MRFEKPSFLDRVVNRVFGFLVRIGIGRSHNFLLEVRGRKTGRLYSTPVNLLEHKGRKYLVAPRGNTEWVRNVTASRTATLRKGFSHAKVRLEPIDDEAKPEILKAYLDRYRLTVQRYFPITAGSPLKAFEPLVAQFPVFEVIPTL